MSDINEKMLARIQKLEREVERLRVGDKAIGGGGGVTDHGALTGLADDDHTQYLNNTRHDTTTRHTLGTVVPHDDHGALSGLSDNDHPQYLLTTGKAADSEKLDGVDSTGFATAGHNHDAAYLGISAKAADSDKLDGYDSAVFGRPVFLTTPKTSTSWDGDTKTTDDRAIVDLSAVFGVPAGVKAVLMSIQTQANAANDYIRFGPNSTYNYALTCRTTVDSQIAHASGIVPCDSNGDVYCFTSATDVENVYVWIWGWWL